MKFSELSLKGKLILISIICKKIIHMKLLVFGIFIIVLINWSIYKIISWLLGAIITSIFMLVAYVFGIRKLVTFLAFPGTFSLFRRGIEYSFCKTMAAEVLKSITEFKNSVEVYLTQNQNE